MRCIGRSPVTSATLDETKSIGERRNRIKCLEMQRTLYLTVFSLLQFSSYPYNGVALFVNANHPPSFWTLSSIHFCSRAFSLLQETILLFEFEQGRIPY